MTADYQPTAVKLHPLKKTPAMNITLNIGTNKRDSETRESIRRNERENDSRKNQMLYEKRMSILSLILERTTEKYIISLEKRMNIYSISNSI